MQTLQHYTLTLADVPALLVSRGAPVDAARRGTILFLHGLGASKETHRPELERLADAGFLAIGIDAAGHGERRLPDFQARFAEGAPGRDESLIQLVTATARELPDLLALLRAAALAGTGRTGVCGVSMGGYITYGAVPSGALDAAVALLASPRWRVEVPEHPVHWLSRFFPCALLSQVAARDELVPSHHVHEFHHQLEPHYAAAPERLARLEYPESGHFMRPEDWDQAMARAVEWFQRFLRAA